MNGLAKLIGSILFFFFLLGVYTALSPRIFMRIGESKVQNKVENLNAQVNTLKEALADTQEEKKEAEELADSLRKQYGEVEQQMVQVKNQAEQKAQELAKLQEQHRDSSRQLVEVRMQLDGIKEEKENLSALYAQQIEQANFIQALLQHAEADIAEMEEQIRYFEPLAARTQQAEQKVKIYQWLGMIPLVVIVLLLSIQYWWLHKNGFNYYGLRKIHKPSKVGNTEHSLTINPQEYNLAG